MSWKSAIEGGVAGATTLELITNTLNKVNRHSPHFNTLQSGEFKKRLKKTIHKKGLSQTGGLIQLAGDLLSSSAFVGLTTIGSRNNSLIRGGIIGTAAGLGNVFLNSNEEKEQQKFKGLHNSAVQPQDKLITKLLKVSLYAIGGMIIGEVIEQSRDGKKGKAKKNKKKK